MVYRIRKFMRTPCGHAQSGFTIMEAAIAMTVALISLIAAYALVLAAGRHHRASAEMTDMYSYSRLAMERMVRDISETSNETVTVRTTYVNSLDYVRDDAISFASARDEDGRFQLASYGAFDFMRPVWQKAIVYYLLEDENNGNGENGYSKTLYRKEVFWDDWGADTGNYDPTLAMDTNGEVIAWNVDYMYFGTPYPEINPEITRKDHVLEVSLGFLKNQDEMGVGPARTIKLNTGAPMMNRDK